MKDKIRKLPPMRLERLTSHFFKKGMKMFKMFRSRKVLSANTSEHLFSPQNSPRLCKCCANSVLKKIQVPDYQTLDS